MESLSERGWGVRLCSSLDGGPESQSLGRADSGLLAETQGRQAGVEGVGLQLVWLETVAQVGQVALDSSEGVRVCHRLNLARRGVSFSDGDQLPEQRQYKSSSKNTRKLTVVTELSRKRWDTRPMSIPFDYIPRPSTKKLNQVIHKVQNYLVAQTNEEPQESYQPGERTDYDAHKAHNDNVKAFVLKHRAQGQDVGALKGADGRLKPHWNQDPTHQEKSTYWNSPQHRKDATEFIKGGAESVGEFVKSQAENTPIMQAKRLILNPLGEYEKHQQQSKAIQEAVADPKKALKGMKDEMHERYVAPIQRGDMRGTGRAGGDIFIKVAEGVTTKKFLAPKPGFKFKKGVNKSTHNGGGSPSGPAPGGGSPSGPTGGTGGVGPSKPKKSSSAQKSQASKPQKAGLPVSLQAQIDKFPQGPQKGYGHTHKHAPKNQAAVRDAAARVDTKGKPGKPLSWFRSQKDMDHAMKTAREWIPEVIKDPAKLKEFNEFVSKPKDNFYFRFRFPAGKNIGRGYEKMPDGSVTKLNNFKSVYAEYAWVKGKGDTWKIALKTIFPQKKEASI